MIWNTAKYQSNLIKNNMKIIIPIFFFILCGIAFGILSAIGKSIFEDIKYQYSNSTFLVYHKSNQSDFEISLERNEGGNFVAVLSQEYTPSDIRKLVDDGVLIPEMLNFNQAKMLNSFGLNTASIGKKKLVRVLVIKDNKGLEFAPIFINKKEFEMAIKIAFKP